MIGTTYFANLCAFYFAMLGLIWMLVDGVYHVIRPSGTSEDISDRSEAKCDLGESSIGTSDNIQELLKTNLGETKYDYDSVSGNDQNTLSRVNPGVNYLSKQNLNSPTKSVFLDSKQVSKRPHGETHGMPFEVVPSSKKDSSNLTIVKNSFNKSELKNNLVLTIREITKLFDKKNLTDTEETSLLFTSHSPADCNRGKTVNFSIHGLDFVLKNQREKTNLFLEQTEESMMHDKKRMKLNNDQILTLSKTARYIINHFDVELKSDLKKQFDKMEISDFLNNFEDYSSLRIKQTTTHMEPNVIITEIDSNDEIEAQKKSKSQRKKKNKKKHRKVRFINQKGELNSPTFSSKQCFERLAFFMSTNQGLTQSKIMLEIEKEFKPIKDQISELRESMKDFVVINQRTSERGVKTSTLSLQPVYRSDITPRSILTVPSVSLQKLAQLADTSNISQGNECPALIEIKPKRLSPLAEMYIKLSNQ